MDSSGDITRLLKLLAEGDKTAEEPLLQITYAELLRLASSFRRRERAELTLQASDLVHEVYLRVLCGDRTHSDRVHFFRAAGQIMRHVLVDHARRRASQKRGGEAIRVPLEDFLVANDSEMDEVIWLDQALTRFAALYPRQAHVVELHFFCGLTMDEIAIDLGVSGKTADRDWKFAKSWLRDELVSGKC